MSSENDWNASTSGIYACLRNPQDKRQQAKLDRPRLSMRATKTFPEAPEEEAAEKPVRGLWARDFPGISQLPTRE